MPNFYIGYTSLEKINKNYHGSVTSRKYKEIWEKELLENPSLFKTKIISTFKTKLEAKISESFIQRFFKVHKNPMYINMSIAGEKFICSDFSEKTRKRMSENLKKQYESGARKKMVEKGSHRTIEQKKKISNTLKGRKHNKERVEARANSRRGKKNEKQVSESTKLKRKINALNYWKNITDYDYQIRQENCKGEKNNFFGKKHSLETIERLKNIDRSYLKKLIWWTNGSEIKRSEICPGENWIRGRKL